MTAETSLVLAGSESSSSSDNKHTSKRRREGDPTVNAGITPDVSSLTATIDRLTVNASNHLKSNGIVVTAISIISSIIGTSGTGTRTSTDDSLHL